MTQKQRYRLYGTLGLLSCAILATYFMIVALEQNINFFFSPQELSHFKAPQGSRIRVGGLVKKNSVIQKGGLTVEFILSDLKQDLKVSYTGILPDLFKEGQGVVVSGIFQDLKMLIADEVLAKHDEKYMPERYSEKLSKRQTREK